MRMSLAGWLVTSVVFGVPLGAFAALAVWTLTRSRSRNRPPARREFVPELPFDFLGGMTPAMDDRWADIVAWYYALTADERVYPRKAKG